MLRSLCPRGASPDLCLVHLERKNNMESRGRATRFSTVVAFIIVAQISMAFPAGRVSGQHQPVVAHNTSMARARPVSQVKPGPCLDNCRLNLRNCIRPAGNSPRLRDQCLNKYRSCLKKCESAPSSPTQPKPGSLGLGSTYTSHVTFSGQ